MLSAFSENAISAKARAIYGGRLTREQYRELMQRRSIPEIAQYLREETDYRETLAQLIPSQVHRGQLETALEKGRYNSLFRLMGYATQKEAPFYQYPLLEVEMDLLLQMLRLLISGHPEEFVTQYPAFLEKRLSFSLFALAKVTSWEEFLAFLKPTAYGAVLAPYTPQKGGRLDYTRCEHALRCFYYGEIQKRIVECYHGETRKELLGMFGVKAHLQNMQTLYRLKTQYSALSGQEMRDLLLPSWNKSHQKELEWLMAAGSPQELVNALQKSRLLRSSVVKQPFSLDHVRDTLRLERNKSILHNSTSAPAAFAALVVLGEMEVQNLIRIIEAIRYNLSQQEMEQLLVFS